VDVNDDPPFTMIGNLRILDSNGYEYRTNLQGTDGDEGEEEKEFTFNFNTLGGVTLSDVIGFVLDNTREFEPPAEVFAADVVNIWVNFEVDIFNINEVAFSCRNVIFACVDEDNPRLEELLEFAGTASVARFEYGINNVIPHSKGGELLCPGNTISEGFVRMELLNEGDLDDFTLFVGLNNGNGRGSMFIAIREFEEET